MGRLVKQHAQHKANQTNIIDRRYEYDNAGNLSQVSDGAWQIKYVYDQLNRLKETQGDLPETFVFDPASNLLGADKNAQIKGNRLLMQADRKFTYDARGNLIHEQRGKAGVIQTTFRYNFANQLIEVSKNNQLIRFAYDPLGRRIYKQDEFGRTDFIWAGDQLAQEIRGGNVKTYIFEPESFKPLAVAQNDSIYHYHLDHLGTPKELTDERGRIVWKARYKTYGNLAVKEVDEFENNLRFQGQYYDLETGLHYNRHRYYDPSIGQFISQDPIGLLGGVNNYQYAPNPTGWVDPFGLSCKEGWAEIYHYKGTESAHFAIVTEHNGRRLGSEQWGGKGTKTLDIPFDPETDQGMELIGIYKVKLPDAKSAQDFQREMIRKGDIAYTQAEGDPLNFATPDYCVTNQSCATHVFKILNAGEKPAPLTSPPDIKTARYIQSLKKESLKLQ